MATKTKSGNPGAGFLTWIQPKLLEAVRKNSAKIIEIPIFNLPFLWLRVRLGSHWFGEVMEYGAGGLEIDHPARGDETTEKLIDILNDAIDVAGPALAEWGRKVDDAEAAARFHTAYQGLGLDRLLKMVGLENFFGLGRDVAIDTSENPLKFHALVCPLAPPKFVYVAQGRGKKTKSTWVPNRNYKTRRYDAVKLMPMIKECPVCKDMFRRPGFGQGTSIHDFIMSIPDPNIRDLFRQWYDQLVLNDPPNAKRVRWAVATGYLDEDVAEEMVNHPDHELERLERRIPEASGFEAVVRNLFFGASRPAKKSTASSGPNLLDDVSSWLDQFC